MNESLERRVRKRAGDRCEYCKIPAYISEFTFPVDHIIAQQHGGKTSYENLALSCPHDNFHKGPNIAGLDPETGKLTRLFNPRRQKWSPHFAWDGPILVGKTPIGRTTLFVLNMNHPDRVEVRRLLIVAGLFPP
jgi:HNH endonuclease